MAKLKCILLIPLKRNDGSAVREIELRRILKRMLVEFGGYTVAGEVEGGWRSPDGQTFCERHTQIWVAVEAHELPKLRKLVGKIGQQLDQKAMYLEVSDATVEILPVPGGSKGFQD